MDNDRNSIIGACVDVNHQAVSSVHSMRSEVRVLDENKKKLTPYIEEYNKTVTNVNTKRLHEKRTSRNNNSPQKTDTFNLP